LSQAVLGGPQPKLEAIYAEGAMGRQGGPGDEDRGGTKGVAAGMEWRTLVTPEHKLVVRLDGTVGAVFDRHKDPHEMQNLAGERSAAALQKGLVAQLQKRAGELGDPFPKPAAPARETYSDAEAAKARG
jgi:hypothetical protein